MQKIIILLLFNSSILAMELSCKRHKPVPLEEVVHQQISPQLRLFMQAASTGNLENLQFFFCFVDLNAETESGESALTKATRQNHTHIVEALLNTNQIITRSQGSIRALLWAVQNGNYNLMHKLVDAGISINSKDLSTGYTALMMAVYKNAREMVTLLLSHSAIDITIKNDDGYTAWTLAIELERWQLAQAISGSRIYPL